MMIADWLSLVAVACLLLVSFFLAGTETALTAASRSAMQQLASDGNARAGLVQRMLERRERVVGTMLLANNAARIAASVMLAGLLVGWLGTPGIIHAAITMTVVVVVFAEILPKSLAVGAPDRFALATAWPASVLDRLLTPALNGIEAAVRAALRLFGIKAEAPVPLSAAHDELRGAVDYLHRSGSVEKVDRDMLGGLLDLRDLVVSDVMIHRTEMVTVNADEPTEAIIRAVLAAGKTRIPLWREKPENIVGILHTKDLLQQLAASGGDFIKVDIGAIMRPPWFVPDIRPLSEQLKAFRRRKTPFALVVDEYGEVMGLVTLTDILAEIIGEVMDEHNVAVQGVRPYSDGSVDVDGQVPIRDLNRAMEWSLPDLAATTVAGLVIHDARSIPEVGQSFVFHGFRFHVLTKHRNRITRVRVTPLSRAAAAHA